MEFHQPKIQMKTTVYLGFAVPELEIPMDRFVPLNSE